MKDDAYRSTGRTVLLAVIMIVSVVTMSAAVVGTAVANGDDHGTDSVGHEYDDAGPTWEEDSDVDTAWIGQEITLDNSELSDPVGIELHAGLASDIDAVVSTIMVHDDDTATFDTSDLESGEAYHFQVEDAPVFHQEVFWVAEEDLEAEFETDTVTEGGTANFSIDSERNRQHLNITSEHFDGEDLENMFAGHGDGFDTGASDDTDASVHTDDVLTLEHFNASDDMSEFEVNFAGVDAGEYEFEIETTDSLSSDDVTIEVADAEEKEPDEPDKTDDDGAVSADDDEEPADDEDDTPGFDLVATAVALLAAAMLVLCRQD